MRIANQWNDYRILDTSGQEKLEQWGNVTLIRPDPQIIWKTPKEHGMWNHADGHYHRSNAGGGSWDFFRKLPESWNIQYTPLDLKFRIQPTSFKHTGLFPDQSVNFLLDELLDMKQIGISLTENGAMYPHASVCGLMFSHPASEYFSVGKIGEDQLEDYTRRRGKSIEEIRKFLAANLQ